MRWLHILRLRFRSLFQRSAVERELDEELRFHFDLQVRENLAAGMDPVEARRAAWRQFGNPTLEKEECRDARRTRMIESFLDDLRSGFRGLRRDPFLALAATLTLAVCIGANTTVFSIANSILIRPLPYPGAERIYWISERSGPAHQDIGTAPDYYRVREGNRSFEDVAAFVPMGLNWTGVERPEQLDAASVSASFFRVMGTPPMLGRYLAPEEEGSKTPPVVVLSYAFWRNRLGGDPDILGKTVGLNRLPHTVIGVMPQGFDYPRGAQMWIPFDLDEGEGRIISPARPIRIVSILARRKPEVTAQQLASDMNRLTATVRAEYPQVFQKRGFRTDLVISGVQLQEYLTGPLRPALLVLTGAVALVLLIACVNVANLLLARAGSRQRELAVRLALGSGRGRMVRQMLTESLVLALPGGVSGVLLAWVAVRVLDATKPATLVRFPAIALDLLTLAFTVVLTFATALIFGMAPALSAAGIRIQQALQSASHTQSAGRGAARLRKALVVVELAMSLVLLIAAGLLGRSFLKLTHTEVGFRADHLLTFRIEPIGPLDRNYSTLYMAVLERVKQLPMANSAALLGDMPLGSQDFYATARIRVVGGPPVPFAERRMVNYSVVSPEFFSTLDVPLKSGRVFDTHDSAHSVDAEGLGTVREEPVVVNESLARRIFPGEDPLGRSVTFGPDELRVIWTIVGVVGDVRGSALGADPPMMAYRCVCAGNAIFRAAFALRTPGDPKSAIRAVEEQVRAVDRDQPITDVKSMEDRRNAALAPERFQLILIGSFAAIAILLAAAGVYGAMSYAVARRTREIGIRVAMGARSGDVLRLILGESALLAAVAVVIGLGGAAALTRYVRSLLFGVTNLDPLTFVLTPLLLAAIVLIASLAPARRALAIDPMTALREE